MTDYRIQSMHDPAVFLMPDQAIRERMGEIERLRAALKIAKDALERDTGNYSFVLQTIADVLGDN